jgi:chitodextrinase
MRKLAAAVVIGVLSFMVTGAAVAPAATNLVANPGFEGSGAGSLSSWGGSGGTLTLVTGDGGGHAGRLTASGTAQMYDYTTSKPAKSVGAGVAYTAGGRVSSVSTGQSVCLQIKEVPSGGSSTVGSAKQCITATTAWTSFPAVNYTTKTAGDSLTIDVIDAAPSANASFDLDNVSLTTGTGGGDVTAPTVPQHVSALGDSSTTVSVTWDASTDNTAVTGYNVYRGTTLVKTTGATVTSFEDSGLTSSTTYSYSVNAFDAGGNTSANSTAVSATTLAGGGGGDITAPSIPQNVSAAGDSPSTVAVTWNASSDNTAVTGYNVYRGTVLVKTTGATATSFEDSGLTASTTYSYTVTAFDAAGNTSAPSAAATATTLSGGGGSGTAPCGMLPASTAPYKHVVVFMEENLTFSDFSAASDAPEMHTLSANCRFLSDSAGETHPSFPNYEAITSGQFSTCLGCPTTADNIFHQIDGTAGMSWRDYNQSMPSNCATNTSKVSYYRDGHNPAFWYSDLGSGSGGDGSCAKNDIPLDPSFWNDVAADNLPSFSWIAPDDCRDLHWMNGVCENVVPGKTHDDRVAVGDAFLQQVIAAITATPSYQAGQTLIVFTFDESNYLSTQAKGNWGIDCSNHTVYLANTKTCQVATVLISARIPAGATSAFYSHYSLGAAIEQNFGLPLLGHEASVTPAPIY